MAIPKDDKSPDFESLIAQAEAAVEALRDTYRVQLSSDVAELCDIWSRIETEGVSSDLLDAPHGVAHNVQGQGRSFGYELVTELGASFCYYLRSATLLSAV